MKHSAAKQPTLIALFAGAVAALMVSWCPAAMAATFDINLSIAKGYAPMGPILVDAITANTLVLYSQPKNTSVNLKGKTVSVKDQSNNPLTLASVTKGTRVYVLQKAKEVIIVVLPAKEAKNDH
ncbi:MAG: hypothetical protein AB1733_23085 [Thermodesulfobacteriota bacterium]